MTIGRPVAQQHFDTLLLMSVCGLAASLFSKFLQKLAELFGLFERGQLIPQVGVGLAGQLGLAQTAICLRLTKTSMQGLVQIEVKLLAKTQGKVAVPLRGQGADALSAGTQLCRADIGALAEFCPGASGIFPSAGGLLPAGGLAAVAARLRLSIQLGAPVFPASRLDRIRLIAQGLPASAQHDVRQ